MKVIFENIEYNVLLILETFKEETHLLYPYHKIYNSFDHAHGYESYEIVLENNLTISRFSYEKKSKYELAQYENGSSLDYFIKRMLKDL